MEKSNKKQNCKDYILQILEAFETEFQENSVNGRLKEEFVSEYRFPTSKRLAEYLEENTDIAYSTAQEVIRELQGKEVKGVKGDALIYFDKENSCFRIQQTTSLNNAHYYSNVSYTFLFPQELTYLEVSHNMAFSIAMQLNEYFPKNDIRTYALAPNLLLCIDLEIPDNQQDEYRKIDLIYTNVKEGLYDRLTDALNSFGYQEQDYSINQTPIEMHSRADDWEQQMYAEREAMEQEEQKYGGMVSPESIARLRKLRIERTRQLKEKKEQAQKAKEQNDKE